MTMRDESRVDRAGPATPDDLSPGWSRGLPLGFLAILLAAMLGGTEWFMTLNYKEGPVEWATVVVALAGAAAALIAFNRRRAFPHRRLALWTLLFAAGMFYIAGEETSWGQHIRHPRLPGDPENAKNQGLRNIDPRKVRVDGETRAEVLAKLNPWQRINDQAETNLHNLPGIWGDLFGQKPKQVIEHASLVFCIILPLFFARRFKLNDAARLRYWLLPTTATTTAAVIAVLLPWPKRIYRLFHEPEPSLLRLSEPQEFFLALTLALYAASLAVRLRRHAQAQAREPNPSTAPGG